MEKTNNEINKPGVQSRAGLYQFASKYAREAIDKLYFLMTTSKNESVVLGAAKAILNKSLPDLKAIELNNPEDKEIKVEIVEAKNN